MKTPISSASKTRWFFFTIVLLIAAGLGLWWYLQDTDDDGMLRLYGNVDIREVELSFRQPGRVTAMIFDEGDTVTAGSVMATIDDGPYRDALAARQAELRAALSEYNKLRSGNRPQEIQQAQEVVKQAHAAAHEAERNFKRQSALLQSGASSQRTVDAARAARDQATAGLTSSKAALSMAKDGFRSEDIDAGAARVAAAEAAVAEANTALSDTELVAPSNATVLVRVREPGSMVTSNSTVYSLSLGDPVYVRAYVSEPDLGRIAPGTQVHVSTDSSSKIYLGQIGFISPRAEFTPKAVETTDLRTDLVYRLRVIVNDADQGLRQGMPVTVVVKTQAAPNETASRQ